MTGRYPRLRETRALLLVAAAAAPLLHAGTGRAAEPSAAELALAKTYIDTKMSAEQKSLLEKLAKAEGKDAARVLLELVGSKTLGEKSFDVNEPAPAPAEGDKKDEKK